MLDRRFGRPIAVVMTAAALIASLGASGNAAPETGLDDSPVWTKQRVGGELVAPSSPNPYLANLPTGEADFRAWNAYAAHRSVAARNEPPRGPRSDAVNERPGNNDTPNKAQRVFLDTDNADGTGMIDVIGTGHPPTEGTVTDAGFTTELTGSITDAKVLPILGVGDTVTGDGIIGDEDGDPFDFDFFELAGLSAGDTIRIDIDTPVPFGDLDPFVGFWGSDGPFPIIAANDDDGYSWDSLLVVTVPADGDYYVSVGGWGAFVPADPFDSSSPSDTGQVGSQGDYSYTISSLNLDDDYYKFDLEVGDVFGATVFGGMRLELSGPDGQLLMGSSQDITFIHPAASPLPGGGDASLSYVIDEPGRYTLRVSTTGDYVAELRAFRPFGDVPGRGTQVLFIDFDGATVDMSAWGAPPGVNATLSPLSSFLGNWGLGAGDEDAVIDTIMDAVVENLEHDIEAIGGNDDYAIEILNSRDHAEPTGPLVSTIVVGGTIPEFGIQTVGIAESIDVGNFETDEVAVVLLDLLSAPPGAPNFIPGLSLNSFPIDPGASIIDLIGIAVGNITAHEAGHFFANWHTDQFNPNANIMDQGGNLPGTIGVGPDGVFGSPDDVDVDFGEDVFVPNEGFTGVEDTLTSIGFGLWSDGS